MNKYTDKKETKSRYIKQKVSFEPLLLYNVAILRPF